jgi:hypothetical protein
VIDRIVVTDDIFRATTAFPPDTRPNIVWLHNLMQANLAGLTEIRPATWFANYWKTIGVPPSNDNWARYYFTLPTETLIKKIRKELTGSLVIAFELSYLLQSALDANDIPWVDLGVSPIRFLEDLAIYFRFSRHFDVAPMAEFFVTETDIQRGVNHVREFYKDVDPVWQGSVIFFAQTDWDMSLIGERGFYPVWGVVPKLVQLAAGRPLLVKPHPFMPNNVIIRLLQDRAGAKLVEANTYAMLAKGEGCTFATISSSVGHEAMAFGNNAVMFNEKMATWIGGRKASLFCYRDRRFWSQLLSQVLGVRPVTEESVGVQVNYLRNQINGYSFDKTIW